MRRPEQFRRAFLLWTGAVLRRAFCWCTPGGACAGSAATRRCCRRVLLLTGTGLILMISLRDPVRDNLLFVDFAQGAAGGCVLLAVASALDYERLFGQAELRAAAGQLRAFGAADPVRLGPGHERRQGQPVRLSAGGDHPPAAGVLPGGLFRAALGRAAARARNARLGWPRSPAASIFRRSNTPCRCWSAWRSRWCSSSCRRTWGRRWCSPACSWRSTAWRAAARFVPAAGPGAGGARASWPAIALGVPHTVRRARLHVAFALGQPGARRRSTGAFAVGLRHRRRFRHGHRAGRSADWCRPRTPI